MTTEQTGARPLPPHGHISRYKYHGCRCLTCHNGWRDYARDRSRQKAYGTWKPLVDAGPVRSHIQTLRSAGIGWIRLAELTGMSTASLKAIVCGRSGKTPVKRVRAATAEKVLAVRPEPVAQCADGALVDATGTRRRIQALAAVGFTFTSLAPHLSTNRLYVGDIAVADLVMARTARRTAEVYDRLWDADPLQHGATVGGVSRARRLAAREGWPPPLAWDDDTIDDPAAVPDMGQQSRRCGDTADEIAWLLETGERDPEVIGRRLGLETGSVKRTIERHGLTVRRVGLAS